MYDMKEVLNNIETYSKNEIGVIGDWLLDQGIPQGENFVKASTSDNPITGYDGEIFTQDRQLQGSFGVEKDTFFIGFKSVFGFITSLHLRHKQIIKYVMDNNLSQYVYQVVLNVHDYEHFKPVDRPYTELLIGPNTRLDLHDVNRRTVIVPIDDDADKSLMLGDALDVDPLNDNKVFGYSTRSTTIKEEH